MSQKGIIIANITVLVALGILALSSVGNMDKIKPPSQTNGTHTGYPVWHPYVPGDEQKNVATIIFSVILMIAGGLFAFEWTKFDAKTNRKLLTHFVDKEENRVPTIEFDRYLASYCLVTSLTGIMYFLIDVGKIWSTVGILHNANEIIIMACLHQGGRITSNSTLAWVLLYVLFAGSLSIYLDWPYDAFWFKIQGLCSDYALVIQFIRIYFNTHKEYDHESRQRLFDPERPRHDNTSGGNAVSEHETTDDRDYGPFRPSYHTFLLILASFFHIFGNFLTTIWIYSFNCYMIFSFTYCITYPLYAYFVYLDTHTVAIPPVQKIIVLPDTSTLKVTLVTLSSIFLALLTAKLSLLEHS